MIKSPQTDAFCAKLSRSRKTDWDKWQLTASLCASIEQERDEAREQRDLLVKVIDAATTLIAAKGRHNTMLAYCGLRDALSNMKDTSQP